MAKQPSGLPPNPNTKPYPQVPSGGGVVFQPSVGSSANQSVQTATQKSTTTPEGLVPLAWYDTPAASASNDPMNRAGVAASLSVVMPFRGSIVAITLSSTGTKAGGTATFQVRKNGAAISNALLTWPNAARASVRFVKGTLGFVRDDRLDVTFTTSSGYTPTTSIVEVIIWATQDSEETV